MTIWDKLNAMRYDLIAPKEDALLNESKNLDEKISDTSPLQKAVSKLSAKIQESKTWEERYVLEKQLNELEEIYILYQKYERKNVTNKTKIELNNLFEWITQQINLKENTINDDNERIEELLENEEERLEDTIDIIWNLTIRDIVEKYIDIDWVMESLSPKEYQEFFDIFTITYIDYIENLTKNRLSKNNEKTLIETDWIFIKENDIQDFIRNLINNLKNKKIDLDFNMEIKLKTSNIKKNIITINLKKEENKTTINSEQKINNKSKIKSEDEAVLEKNKNTVLNKALDFIINEEKFGENPYPDYKQYSWWYWTRQFIKDMDISENEKNILINSLEKISKTKKVPKQVTDILNKINISKQKAREELKTHVLKVEKFIDSEFPNINSNQKIALISFFYNNWTSKKWKSNLMFRLKNMWENVKWIWYIKPLSIANVMLKYDKAWGEKLAWLTKRRKKEVELFLKS